MGMIIAGIMLLIIGGILLYAATRPDAFRVQRSASMKAPADKIFPLINDFHEWSAWSPYEELDPAMRRTYSGADRGKGAVYAWSGNNKAGEGRMEITESSPSDKIVTSLHFDRPFKADNTAEFILAPKGDSTDVTWAIHGKSPFVSKLMGIFVNMDNLLGRDFDKGLAKLKSLVER